MRQLLLFSFCCASLLAHPMGNFSVSHFSSLEVTKRGVELQYVLDLAEIPTLELLRTWGMDRSTPAAKMHARAVEQAREWLKGLTITDKGGRLAARFESVNAVVSDGAGNLPILRMDIRAHIEAGSGLLKYEDRNYPERAGWKEIVVTAGSGASLLQASQSGKDLSNALKQYPPDPRLAPPQDLRAEVQWKTARPLPPAVMRASKNIDQPVIASIPQPHHAPAAVPPATMTAQGAPQGSVVRGDYLSRLMRQRELSVWMVLIALAAAFGLGAVHALTPGHGKAIVAAYLVGSRGTLKHAAFLGGMVTFTHTITVFLLGLATLFLFRFIVPEKITVLLGVVSGLSIVVVGAFMLRKRIRQASHKHSHVHAHSHPHDHDHSHPHDHHHHHGPGGHTHGHTHSHVPEELSWGGLMALGASGGLVPCESALVLLLGAIALGRVGFGLLLLLSFSLGLALVLTSIGVLVLYAKSLLPESSRRGTNPFLRWASVASPTIVMIVGVLMTAASLGWIGPKWIIS